MDCFKRVKKESLLKTFLRFYPKTQKRIFCYKDKDMTFLRDYFKIPRNIETRWVLFEENHRFHIGVELVGHNKIIDVADACFRQSYKDTNIKPVIHVVGEFGEIFTSEDNVNVQCKKNYVREMYFRRIFSKKLLETPLL